MKPNPDQRDIAPTLAEILEISYDIPSGRALEIGEDFAGEKILLTIIDSLDWPLYLKFGKSFLRKTLGNTFEEFKISSPATETSPAIATILTGLNPEEHRVFSTNDAWDSEILNLPEFAQLQDVDTTVIMEAGGASVFSRTMNVTPVKDVENIRAFDKEIISGIEKSISEFRFIVCHLRTIDEYFHQGRNLKEIGKEVERILGEVIRLAEGGKYLLVITGDHRSHGKVLEGSEMLPLIFLDFTGSSR